MAELLGTIASGIAVAEVGMKVGGTVFKLRELWKEVQEVPDNIRVLMQEIDALVPLLSTVEDNFDAGTTVLVDNGAVPALNTTTHGQKVSVLCRSALCDLQNLVEELNAEVSSAKKRKRGVGKIKVVLKKEEMKKFQSKLERAVKLLNTAQLSHVTELVRLIPQAITQQLATITQQSVTISTTKTLLGPATSSSPAKENEVQDQELTKRSNRRQPQYYQQHRLPPTTPTYFGRILIKTFETDSSMLPTWMARFQAPTWLSRRVWEIQACSGWQYSITTFNVVPDDSPAFHLIEECDWDGLCELFRKGLASPLDCDKWGRTLFELACQFSSYTIAQEFLERNMAHIRLDSAAHSLFWFLLFLPFGSDIDNDMQILTASRLLDLVVEETVGLEPQNAGYWVKRCLLFSEGWFETQISLYFPGWTDFRPRNICGLVLNGVNGSLISSEPGPIRCLVRKHGPIQADDVRIWQEDGISLLHWIVTLFGISNPYTELQWKYLLIETVQAAATDLHLMQSVPWRLRGSLLSPVTPLVCLLGGFAYTLRYRIRNLESLHQSLRLFLTVLQSCGVNLEEYGRREFELWSEEYGANHVEAMSCVRFPSGMISIYVDEEVLYPVDTIHYGPTLEDWSFESDFVQDFLATFWDMVENPPRDEIMPGTWVEDE